MLLPFLLVSKPKLFSLFFSPIGGESFDLNERPPLLPPFVEGTDSFPEKVPSLIAGPSLRDDRGAPYRKYRCSLPFSRRVDCVLTTETRRFHVSSSSFFFLLLTAGPLVSPPPPCVEKTVGFPLFLPRGGGGGIFIVFPLTT